MISKILDNLTWISIFMIVGGVILAIVGGTSGPNGVDIWGLKVMSADGGVALAIAGGVLMLRPVMLALRISGKTASENGLLYITVIVEENETAIGVSNAKVSVDLLEGKRLFTTDRDGNAHIGFTPQNKLTLKKTTLTVASDGYESLTNQKLELEADTIRKFKIKRNTYTNHGDSFVAQSANLSLKDGVAKAIKLLLAAKDQEAKDTLRNVLQHMTDSQKIAVSAKMNEHDFQNNNFNPKAWRDTFVSVLKDL